MFIGKIRNIEKLTSIGDKREYWKLCWGNEDEDLKIVVRCMVLNTPV